MVYSFACFLFDLDNAPLSLILFHFMIESSPGSFIDIFHEVAFNLNCIQMALHLCVYSLVIVILAASEKSGAIILVDGHFDTL